MEKLFEVPSPVREYTQLKPLNRLRHLYWSSRLGKLGSGTFIDRDVSFDRFPKKIFIGEQVLLKAGARLCPTQAGSSIQIGDWASIGYHVYLFAASGITIGKDSMIGPFSYIIDNQHQTERSKLMREQPLKTAPIVIEEDVWLGARCIVLAGVTIGRGSVISAGTTVFQDIPPYSIVAGSPARVIGQR